MSNTSNRTTEISNRITSMKFMKKQENGVFRLAADAPSSTDIADTNTSTVKPSQNDADHTARRFVQLSNTSSTDSNKAYHEQFSQDINHSQPNSTKPNMLYQDEVRKVVLGRRTYGGFNLKLAEIQSELSGVSGIPKKKAIDELDEITMEQVLDNFKKKQERSRQERLYDTTDAIKTKKLDDSNTGKLTNDNHRVKSSNGPVKRKRD